MAAFFFHFNGGRYFTMKVFDTIAAIATPYGKGGVAMIRISGADAFCVADKIFACASGNLLSEMPVGRACYGEIREPSGTNKSVDDGIAVCFKAPRSFTGEDTVEISCHGGILVTQRVLSCALSAGARMAEAGEFTRRAYVSGKIRLNEAEALGNLLEAKSDSQLSLARNGMQGRLSMRMEELYLSLRRVLTGIYASIDFPDEDLAEMTVEEMLDALRMTLNELKKLASTYKTGSAISEGIPTVICGRTNAGKSSVYNRILGYDAAIVTDIEGTTRDVLRETASLGKATLLLCDTAGIRETEDRVEIIGIERSLRELDGAGLVLAVFDGSREPDGDDASLVLKIITDGAPAIALINKSDSFNGNENARLDEMLRGFSHKVYISAKTGEGFDLLANEIDSMFIDGELDVDNDPIITGARQYAAISRAIEQLTEAIADIERGVSLDACCVEVEGAMSSLGELDGREIGEEIVADIFAHFCVGK